MDANAEVRMGRTRRGIQELGNHRCAELVCGTSVAAFKPDNVHAKTFCTTQQVGINRATQ